MSMHKITFAELIEKAGFLFRTRGYHNTSISDIAKACNLSKASIYHHIPSKKALAIAIIKTISDEFTRDIFSLAYEEEKPELERLNNLTAALEKFLAKQTGGFLLANFALEVMDVIPEFSTLIRKFFKEWTDSIGHLLKGKYGEKAAKRLGLDTVGNIQGAIMMGRIFNEPEQLARICKLQANLLDDSKMASIG